MSLPVIVSPEAERQIDAIDAWWHTNRPAAPQLFIEELAEAVAMIEFAPEVGRRYPHLEVKGVRPLLLRQPGTMSITWPRPPRSSFSQCGDRSEAPVLISRRSDDGSA
jgi:plasmid stabilization system protein ParE